MTAKTNVIPFRRPLAEQSPGPAPDCLLPLVAIVEVARSRLCNVVGTRAQLIAWDIPEAAAIPEGRKRTFYGSHAIGRRLKGSPDHWALTYDQHLCEPAVWQQLELLASRKSSQAHSAAQELFSDIERFRTCYFTEQGNAAYKAGLHDAFCAAYRGMEYVVAKTVLFE